MTHENDRARDLGKMFKHNDEVLENQAKSDTSSFLAQYSRYDMSPHVDDALDGIDHFRALEMYIADVVTQHLRVAYGRIIERYYEGHKLAEFLETVPRIVTYIWLHQIELQQPNVMRIQEITNDLMLMDFSQLMKKYRADYTHGNPKRAVRPLTRPPLKLRLELIVKGFLSFFGRKRMLKRD